MNKISTPVKIVLFIAFVIQMMTAWNTFFFHSDEYFQIIEFASYKLGLSPKNILTWEYAAQIRPTIQPYLFQWLYKLLTSLGINNRFIIFSILHVLVGILGFCLCNYLVIKKMANEKYLLYLVILTNFLGLIPFLRASFSSETMGGLFLLLSLLVLEKSLKEKGSFLITLLAGLCFAFCFFFRFQMAFALVGILAWLMKFHFYQWKKVLIIGFGFILGCGINVYLDSHFYGNLCFTPYNYFYINIVQGKAAEFGTSPWWYYIAILLALSVPLLSFFLFGLMVKGFTNLRNPYSIAIFFFIFGHSLVGHKEERFVFPVLFFIIYLAAEAYRNSLETQNFIARLWRKNIAGFLIRFGLLFSVILNLLFVVVFALFTYKQPVKFISVINNHLEGYTKEIYCYKQSPYCTESNLEYHFLSENKLKFKIFQEKQAFLNALTKNSNSYYSIKYEDAMNDGLVYLVLNKAGTPASPIIWSIAKWLGNNFKIYIPDIWFLSNTK